MAITVPALAQTIVDGDTIKLNGTVHRLYGIDAPEMKQDCPDGWPAGRQAFAYLADQIRGRSIECTRSSATDTADRCRSASLAATICQPLSSAPASRWRSSAIRHSTKMQSGGRQLEREGYMLTTAFRRGNGERSSGSEPLEAFACTVARSPGERWVLPDGF